MQALQTSLNNGCAVLLHLGMLEINLGMLVLGLGVVMSLSVLSQLLVDPGFVSLDMLQISPHGLLTC